MKQSAFITVLFAALIFISCGGGGSKTETTADTTQALSTDTATSATIAVTPSTTIINSGQNMMVAMHKVANFDKWLKSYEEHDSLRHANGLHSYVIGRGLRDTNMVLVAVKVDDLAKAKEFGKSDVLKKAMQKGGVTGKPTIEYMTETLRDTAMASSSIRSKATFKVKDWAAWLKTFEEGKQDRFDHGLSMRVISRDVDDSNKVSVVMAVLDTAKASAYWRSDMLKKRREAGGVIGVPNRFVFRVTKIY